MSGTLELEVVADHAVPVTPAAGGTITILNQSGDTLFYADNAQVSAANNQGSLTATNSATFSLPQWIRSASLTTVQVTFTDPVPATTGGGGGSVSAVSATTGVPAAGTSVDVLTLPAWTPHVLVAGKDTDTLFAPYGASEKDVLADGGVLYTGTFNGNQNAITRSPAAVVVPNLGGLPRPGFQVATDVSSPFGQAQYFIDGGLPNDQFTLSVPFQTDPAQATELANITTRNILTARCGNAPQSIVIQKNGANLTCTVQNQENASGLGGANSFQAPQVALTTPLSALTCNITSGSAAMTAISGTTQPTVGTMVAGRGIRPFTYITAVAGISGAWTATLSTNASMTLTGTVVNFSDCPLNVAAAAAQTQNGTTANASTSVTAWAGAAITPGMAISGAGIPVGTYVQAYNAGTITLSQNATASATVPLTVTDSFYPPNPVAIASLIWDGTNLTFMLGENRKSQAKVITTGTANGTITGNAVTAWAGTITPTTGMAVTGSGIPDGARISSAVSGGSGNWSFSLNVTPTTQGSVSMTVFQPLMPRPWSSTIGKQGHDGLYIGSANSPANVADTIIIAGAPWIQRWARPFSALPSTATVPVPTAATPLTAPAVSIDVQTVGGAFPAGVGGIVGGNYTGNAWTEAAEVPFASIRNQQIALAVSLGLLYRREKEFQGRAIPTVRAWAGTASPVGGTQSMSLTLTTGAAPQVGDVIAGNGMAQPATVTSVSGTGPYTVGTSVTIPVGTTVAFGGGAVTVNFTDLRAAWDRWHTAYGGVAGSAAPIAYKVHQHLGYVPSALNNGGGDTLSKPNVTGLNDAAAFALFASYLSKVVLDLQVRYPTHLDSLSLMNEPEGNVGTWTTTTFAQCWSVISGQIAADQGANGLRLGGVEGNWSNAPSGTNASAFQQSIMSQAQADGRALPRLYFHDYSGSRATILEEILALRNMAVGFGFTPAIALPELDFVHKGVTNTSQEEAVWDNEAGVFSVMQAAYVHDMMWRLGQAGVDRAHGYQLGQDPTANWSGQFYKSGLFSQGNTPRALPQSIAYSLFWRHAGSRLTGVSSNWEGICAFGSKNGNVVTVTISSLLPTNAKAVRPIQFGWSNLASLPATYVWRLWRYDQRDIGDARPRLAAQGNQTNLPEGTELSGCGLACIQISAS